MQTCISWTLLPLKSSLHWMTVLLFLSTLLYCIVFLWEIGILSLKNTMNTSCKTDKNYQWYTIPSQIVDNRRGQGHMSKLRETPLTPLPIKIKSLTSLHCTCKPVSYPPYQHYRLLEIDSLSWYPTFAVGFIILYCLLVTNRYPITEKTKWTHRIKEKKIVNDTQSPPSS